MAYYFSMEIDAPEGLAGIEELLLSGKMELQLEASEYIRRQILRRRENSDFEWSMGFHKNGSLVGSGEFNNSIEDAVENLKSLSEILTASQFAHEILLDDETGYLYKAFRHNWLVTENTS